MAGTNYCPHCGCSDVEQDDMIPTGNVCNDCGKAFRVIYDDA